MRVSRLRGAVLVTGAALALSGVAAPAYSVTYTYSPLPQAEMTAVYTDSVEQTGEGDNGPLDRVLDGKTETYWHTKWQGTDNVKAPLPHQFVIDLGKQVDNLGRIILTPRQSSSGSGRFGNFTVAVSDHPSCTQTQVYPALADGIYRKVVKEVNVSASPDDGPLAPVLVDFDPVKARCVRVEVKSAWGGDNSAEEAASLAEFQAFTASAAGDEEDAPPAQPIEIVVPEGALEITDGKLIVRTHPKFPQVIDYRLGGKQLAGKYGDAMRQVKIDGHDEPVSVSQAVVSEDKTSVTYPVTFTDWQGTSFDIIMSVKDQVLDYRISNVVDPDKRINRIEIPQLDIVSVNSANDKDSALVGARIDTDRRRSGDMLISVAQSSSLKNSVWMAGAYGHGLAAGFETNAIDDQTAKQNTSGNDRYVLAVRDERGTKVGSVSPYEWVYRGGAVKKYAPEGGIGTEPDPFIKVKITDDANNDGVVDWQDSAIATRDVLCPFVGMNDTKNRVITRIPFNIVSQATHPFLRTLDDTKRVALATDGLGQQVLLKGYQAEGHDSAQGDYGNNYNERAGGLKDLKTLVDEGKNWNATFGIHVNATESYSEAKCFSDGKNGFVDKDEHENGQAAPCELWMPPRLAWGWMNQAYYMNDAKDLATGNVFKRLEQLRKDFPKDSNLNWLYWDVYYKKGWQAEAFSRRMQEEQGWRIGSEWAYSLPTLSTWSHWANDEPYGGSENKGLNSTLIRFVQNSYRDTFNPHPMLGNTNVYEYEGWAGNVDYNKFHKTVWEKNLPAKFLQQSDIMSWKDPSGSEPGKITFKNGTEVTSALRKVSGFDVAPDRVITYDGATVYDKGDYLLPWKDGGKDRLYYYNPGNEARTWKLTKTWASQPNLKLYELTDTGRAEVATIPVNNGEVRLPATKPSTAYVLYPTSDLPKTSTPNWGQGSGFKDPGFFSGTLDAYETSGEVAVVTSDRRNFQAEFGSGKGALSQAIKLPTGDYSAWAWVEIERGKTREVSVSVKGKGIKPVQHQNVKDNYPTTIITDSGARNSTASDEKFKTYFQRVPVRFHTDGTELTFAVEVGDGDARVAVDDLRVVRFKEIDPNPTSKTIVFTNFEDTDTGYWPFVTGSANGGDARTQLALRNEPYSQAGWWGAISQNPAEKQKYLDNVLDGNWSLLAHEETSGLILRTTSASVPMKTHHTYRVTFDYQAAYDGDYQIVAGHDEATDAAWTQVIDKRWSLKSARGKGWTDAQGKPGSGTQRFTTEIVAGDHPSFIGVMKTGGLRQGDLVIDNFRVEDLGVRPVTSIEATAAKASDSKRNYTVTTKIETFEDELSGVEHKLDVPEGWTATRDKAGSNTAKPGEPSVATWTVTAPKTSEPGDVVFTGRWRTGEGEDTGTARITIDPRKVELVNPIAGADLTVVDKSSEQLSGEPAPNGPAVAAIDGDPATYWHTQWSPTEVGYPHHITLQPKAAQDKTCTFTGLEYTPRQSQANGRMKTYEIYVSTDGQKWGNPVAKGQFADGTVPTVVELPATEGKFVKLVGLDAQNGEAFGGAGEIRLGGTCGEKVDPTPGDNPTDKPSEDPQPGPTPKSNGKVSLDKEIVERGSSLTITGSDFAPEEKLKVTVDSDLATVFEGKADAHGGITVTWAVPEDLALGSHVVRIAGESVAEIEFEVVEPTPRPDPMPEPQPGPGPQPGPTPDHQPTPDPAEPSPGVVAPGVLGEDSVVAEKPAPRKGVLSHTGVDVVGLFGAGVMFVLAGVVVTRRRRA
ncbi:discoidin domain-containing protein [Trueperella pyogenes]|uniref:endo-alpha-N-acetylgalactosaminidase family protein n=1 Tax=Trueperella pyogenes TaxID=1661 RepID=UPI00216878EF|nr:endo-alpha-N-acetylgalactosaminidase family protein [Trueperella pyogenes]UVJ54272.1 discoidin domain-containing protein [Trueperella pyogenes]